MAGKTMPVLLVTANVGSIFEDPSVMLKIWTEEFLSTVARLDPKFVALHCQEVGGKNYERSMKHVEYFVRLLMSSEELRLFDKVRVYLDEDYSSAENFTALGNFYFIHESISDVLIWDFIALSFVPAKGKEVHSGNIEAVSTKEKSKFPQDFFPECKWSRKGFLRTRWSLNGTVFDLINIHLFHDASNFIAMESFPSVYCKNRRRALEHTLERFHNDDYGAAPFFVFGDFNFRTDTQGVIKKLTDDLNPVRVQSNKNSDHTKLQYRDDTSQVILSLGKKEFSHVDHETVFIGNDGKWLKEFDRELEPFNGRLFEFSIAFPPSYPFEEDEKGANRYMQTRCPSWCDRVILSSTAKSLVNNITEPGSVEYGLMGQSACMGDHKPVYLKAELLADAGTVSCCTYGSESPPCFGRVSPCWSCSKSLKATVASVFVTESPPLTLSLNISADSSSNYFLAPPHAALLHEPYTPESMETPSSSPIPVRVQRDFGEIELGEWRQDSVENTDVENIEMTISNDTNEIQTLGHNIVDTLQPLNNAGVNSCINSPSTIVLESDVERYSPSVPLLSSPKCVLENKAVPLHSESVSIPNRTEPNPFNFLQDYNDDTTQTIAKARLALSNLYLKDPVKRVQSASTVETSAPVTSMVAANTSPNLGVRTCRCFSDSWRRKTVPSFALQNVHSHSRVRLISSCGLESSPRLQSHHSSSDEDWFEEVESETVPMAFPVLNKGSINTVSAVPIDNISDVSSDPYNDVFIIQPPNLDTKTVPIEHQNQLQIPVFDSRDNFLMPSTTISTKDNLSSILITRLDEATGNQQSFDSDYGQITFKAFNVQTRESCVSGINKLNNDDSTCETQSLKNSRLSKTAQGRNQSSLSSCASNKDSDPIEQSLDCSSNVQSIQDSPGHNEYKSHPKRESSQRTGVLSLTSVNSLMLSVSNDPTLTNQIMKVNEESQISCKKNIATKKRKSGSDRKINHCCVMI